MKRLQSIVIVFFTLLFVLAGLRPAFAGEALIADVKGAIGPATAAYVEQAIDDAEAREANVLVLRIDTPGGLDTSMRTIIQSILASKVPVVGYVAPSGARAASAGTYILYACHVAAMAPGTNLGAATPIEIGGLPDTGGGEGATDEADGGDAKKNKLVNDAVAYIRSLAQMRGRNIEWAESAVRSAESLPAEEAVEKGVIDYMASDLSELLDKIDGRLVEVADGQVTIETAGVVRVHSEPNWQIELLAIISDPNIAYILMLVGIYGLVYEFSNPGAILPGTVGAVSLLLALYAFQLIPVNFAGVALLLLGLGLMVAEAFVPSFGALGIGGIAAFVVGSLMLVDAGGTGYGVSSSLVIAFAITSAIVLIAAVRIALAAHTRPVVSGGEELIGAVGRAVAGFPGEGSVHLHGETWSAHSDQAIAPGDAVTVEGRDGMTLLVRPKT